MDLRAEILRTINSVRGEISEHQNTILHFYMNHRLYQRPTDIHAACVDIEGEFTEQRNKEVAENEAQGIATPTVGILDQKILNIQYLNNRYAALAALCG